MDSADRPSWWYRRSRDYLCAHPNMLLCVPSALCSCDSFKPMSHVPLRPCPFVPTKLCVRVADTIPHSQTQAAPQPSAHSQSSVRVGSAPSTLPWSPQACGYWQVVVWRCLPSSAQRAWATHLPVWISPTERELGLTRAARQLPRFGCWDVQEGRPWVLDSWCCCPRQTLGPSCLGPSRHLCLGVTSGWMHKFPLLVGAAGKT